MDRLAVLLKQLQSIQNKIDKVAGEDNDSKRRIAIRRSILASRIKAYRAKNNLDQEELARKLGVGRAAIIRWEKARSTPSSLAMEKLINIGVIKKES